MGLYVGNRPVDMFSMLHGNRGVKAFATLPDLASLTDKDIGQVFVVIPGGSGTHIVGHMYQVTLVNGQLEYADLNENGGGVSAFYDAATKELIV